MQLAQSAQFKNTGQHRAFKRGAVNQRGRADEDQVRVKGSVAPPLLSVIPVRADSMAERTSLETQGRAADDNQMLIGGRAKLSSRRTSRWCPLPCPLLCAWAARASRSRQASRFFCAARRRKRICSKAYRIAHGSEVCLRIVVPIILILRTDLGSVFHHIVIVSHAAPIALGILGASLLARPLHPRISSPTTLVPEYSSCTSNKHSL